MNVLALPPTGHAVSLRDSEPGASRRWAASFAGAMLLEALILGITVWLASRQQTPPARPALQITLAPAPAPQPKVVTPAPKLQPKPRQQAEHAPKPHAVTHATRALPRPQAPATPVQPVMQPPLPVPAPLAADAPPAPPPPPPPRPSEEQLASARVTFEAELREAIQHAVRYPPAARMMQLSGRTLVGFDFTDARVAQVHVLQSSGSSELDQAALQAVHEAYYPPAPASLAGKTLSFRIWVRFVLEP